MRVHGFTATFPCVAAQTIMCGCGSGSCAAATRRALEVGS
jgi:hypothetical protein